MALNAFKALKALAPKPCKPRANQQHDDHDARDDARQRTLGGDGRTVGIEHESAVSVRRYAPQCRRIVEVASGVAEQDAEEPTLHEVARALPKAHVGFGHGLDASRRKVGVHLADAGRHFVQMFLEAQALQIGGQAPPRPSLGDVLAHGFVIDLLRGQRLHAGPHGIALFLGSPPDAFRHGVEVLVRLQDARTFLVGRRKRHDADLLGREAEALREVHHEILAAEGAHDLAAHEHVGHFVRERQLRQRAHVFRRDEALDEFRRAQAFRRVEARLPLFAAVRARTRRLPHHVAAGRLHPGQKAPGPALDGKGALAARHHCARHVLGALREASAPVEERLPCGGRTFGIQSGRRHEILAIDDAIVGEARRRHGIDMAILGGHLLPERRHVLPARPFVSASRPYPFVEREAESLVDVVAQNVEPGLIDVRRAAAREREHELRATACAGQRQAAPLQRTNIGMGGGKAHQLARGRVFRMVRTIAHQERHIRCRCGVQRQRQCDECCLQYVFRCSHLAIRIDTFSTIVFMIPFTRRRVKQERVENRKSR